MSWTLSFIRRWSSVLDAPSVYRYYRHLGRETAQQLGDGTVNLTLRSPYSAKVQLRETGSDVATFAEIFEEKVYQEAADLAGACETIVDLGANIGLASLYLASRNPNARILAVEPAGANWELLNYNLRALQQAGRCCTLRAAAWKANTPLAIRTPRSGRFNAFQVDETGPDQPDVWVEGLTIETLFNLVNFPTVDLLKIDVEGAEVALLVSNSQWLDRVRTLAIEFHGDSRAESGFDQLMKQYGFAIVSKGRHTVVARRQGPFPNQAASPQR